MALFKTPSVDAIMSSFAKTIAALDTLSESKLNEVDKQDDAITQARLKKQEAQAEADKAMSISDKLSKLIGA